MLQELEKMCHDLQFDEERALQLLRETDPNQEFAKSHVSWHPYPTTLLTEAVVAANLRMVELLLKNGADPNFIFDNETENVLWDLQYPGDTERETPIRLQITQLMLERYNADPSIVIEGEDLFSFVAWSVFNDDYGELWKYRAQFFVLLVAYGGKSDYCMPEIVREFDKSDMQQYRFYLVPAGKDTFSGVIVDKEKNIFAYL